MVPGRLLFLVGAATWLGRTSGLDNGLGKLPALGWNSDYCANCTKPASSDVRVLGGFEYESFIIHVAETLATMNVSPIQGGGSGGGGGTTLQQLGYHYVNMDSNWNLKTRTAGGQLMPDPHVWPRGLDYTVGKVHALGLGFGLYGDRGTNDCAGNPGAQGHEADDAAFFAAHKIDFYKEDSCHSTGAEGGAFGQYGRMRDALNATGYPIWFALCGWLPEYAVPPLGGNAIGNSARIGPDTGGGWSAVMTNIRNALSVTQYAGPSRGGSGGYWNDGSLQLTPSYLNHGVAPDWVNVITPDRHRSQFSAWSLLAMNILITGNISALNDYVIETWSNPEVLAINQDRLGRAGKALNVTHTPTVPPATPAVASSAADHAAARLAECGGEPELQVWELGSPAAGYLRNPATAVCLNVNDCRSQVIYDGCIVGDLPSCGQHGGNRSVHPNLMWKTRADRGSRPGARAVGGSPQTTSTAAAETEIVSAVDGSPCLAAAADGSVSVDKCVAGSSSQQWALNASGDGTLKDHSGRCVTASAAPPPPGPGPAAAAAMGIGRPLSGESFAIMLLNLAAEEAAVACGPGCLVALGLVPGTKYTVRDAWGHRDLPSTVTTAGSVSAKLGANGTSAVFVLRPA